MVPTFLPPELIGCVFGQSRGPTVLGLPVHGSFDLPDTVSLASQVLGQSDCPATKGYLRLRQVHHLPPNPAEDCAAQSVQHQRTFPHLIHVVEGAKKPANRPICYGSLLGFSVSGG